MGSEPRGSESEERLETLGMKADAKGVQLDVCIISLILGT